MDINPLGRNIHAEDIMRNSAQEHAMNLILASPDLYVLKTPPLPIHDVVPMPVAGPESVTPLIRPKVTPIQTVSKPRGKPKSSNVCLDNFQTLTTGNIKKKRRGQVQVIDLEKEEDSNKYGNYGPAELVPSKRLERRILKCKLPDGNFHMFTENRSCLLKNGYKTYYYCSSCFSLIGKQKFCAKTAVFWTNVKCTNGTVTNDPSVGHIPGCVPKTPEELAALSDDARDEIIMQTKVGEKYTGAYDGVYNEIEQNHAEANLDQEKVAHQLPSFSKISRRLRCLQKRGEDERATIVLDKFMADAQLTEPEFPVYNFKIQPSKKPYDPHVIQTKNGHHHKSAEMDTFDVTEVLSKRKKSNIEEWQVMNDSARAETNMVVEQLTEADGAEINYDLLVVPVTESLGGEISDKKTLSEEWIQHHDFLNGQFQHFFASEGHFQPHLTGVDSLACDASFTITDVGTERVFDHFNLDASQSHEVKNVFYFGAKVEVII